ncbi:Protein kinase domain-containing protein [Mycena sanguinolenta]|uniref:Protein kinase domain-containing protein n=1 Tax=Mycena sanguinolenta TaxID=230812 RepID=A0A8H6Y635_9AGAR|nr:Protein kinase domain-containing protein [Mycena sanguinolenta]
MPQVLQHLELMLSDRVAYEHLLSCRGTVAQRLLDLLQDLLDSSQELKCKASLSKALVRLSGECGIHPTCFALEVKKVGQQVAGGGFGDIWKGLVGGQIVAVKSMRQFADDDVKLSLKKLGREALIWRQLSHPNLLPFFGMYILENRPCLVSPWMDNGDLKHFLSNARAAIDRVSLVVDVAMGLEYLHGENIVHGDLKTPNILVTPSGRACITDFGLSTIVDELSLKMTFSSRNGLAGTVRYQAPELLNKNPIHYGSDVYAFACVSYEILTSKVPFFEITNDVTVLLQVIQGLRPSRLEVISPDLWLLLEDCWHQQVDKRPTTSAISQRLLNQPIGGVIKQSPPDWDDAYSARFRRSLQQWPLFPSIAETERRTPLNAINIGYTSSVVYESSGRSGKKSPDVYTHSPPTSSPYTASLLSLSEPWQESAPAPIVGLGLVSNPSNTRLEVRGPEVACITVTVDTARRSMRATRRFTPFPHPPLQEPTPAQSPAAKVRMDRAWFKTDDSVSAVKRDPSDARWYYNRAATCMKHATFPEALKEYSLVRVPDRRRITKAFEATQEAREHDPENKHTQEISEQEMKCQQALFSQRGTEIQEATLERAIGDPVVEVRNDELATSGGKIRNMEPVSPHLLERSPPSHNPVVPLPLSRRSPSEEIHPSVLEYLSSFLQPSASRGSDADVWPVSMYDMSTLPTSYHYESNGSFDSSQSPTQMDRFVFQPSAPQQVAYSGMKRATRWAAEFLSSPS